MTTKEWLLSALAIIVLIVSIIILGINNPNVKKVIFRSSSVPTSVPVKQEKLMIEDIKIGSGKTAQPGDIVQLKIISNKSINLPIAAGYSLGKIIDVELVPKDDTQSPWNKVSLGMSLGSRRLVTLDPETAYGSGPQTETAPPLVLEVELVKIN